MYTLFSFLKKKYTHTQKEKKKNETKTDYFRFF